MTCVKDLFLLVGCDAKHFFYLILGASGEQPDLETPPKDEDKPVFKKFWASSPSPSSTSATLTVSSATPEQPPTKHFIPPWEVGSLASIPARQQPVFELCDGSGMKKILFSSLWKCHSQP